jgi:hypothetical protein
LRGGNNTTFNIGTQNAASIQNIAGDAHIERVQVSASWETNALRTSIARAQEQVRALELPPDLRASLDGELNSAAAEAAKDEPDKHRLSDLLGRAGRLVKEAGAVASGGAAVIETLKQAVTLLGPVGHAALALL